MKDKCGIRSRHDHALSCVLPEIDSISGWLDKVHDCFSPNTDRALRADLKVFREWCAIYRLQAWPAEPETLVRFITSAARKKSPATVKRYVWSIATLHRLAGLESPFGVESQMALKRMQRRKSRRQRQVAGLTWRKCERLLATAGSRLIDVRDRALLAVAYDGLLRRSELVSLQVSDLNVNSDGSATLLVRRSKTDQEGDGAWQYLDSDTAQLVQEWTRRASIREGWLFLPVRANGTLGDKLDDSRVPYIFREMARRAGFSEKFVRGISGHSPRVGAAQDMIANGIELPMVMQAGRWKSPRMVSRYGERLLPRRGGAAKLASLRKSNR